VKLVLDEPGSQDAQELYLASTSIHSSRLLVPETQSAVARAVGGGRFAEAGKARAFELLDALLDEVRPVELQEWVAARAGDLARTSLLRGADAVHLASFERIEAGDAVLVAADGDLVDAALTFGHAVAVPGS
jgi:predicted nucleic acid-binding protein